MPSGARFLAYDIYRDAAGTQRWGTGPGDALTGVSSANPQVLTAYARTASAPASPGQYDDVVTVTLSF